jgi:hypothetical protein
MKRKVGISSILRWEQPWRTGHKGMGKIHVLSMIAIGKVRLISNKVEVAFVYLVMMIMSRIYLYTLTHGIILDPHRPILVASNGLIRSRAFATQVLEK